MKKKTFSHVPLTTEALDAFDNMIETEISSSKEDDMRIWWREIEPQTLYYVPVRNIQEAVIVFAQFVCNGLQKDWSNAGGLEVYRNGEWEEWYDEDGEDIDFYNDESYDTYDGIEEDSIVWIYHPTHEDVDFKIKGRLYRKKKYLIAQVQIIEGPDKGANWFVPYACIKPYDVDMA